MVKIPENYTPSLGLYETQKAIGLIKNVFLVKICAALHLKLSLIHISEPTRP